MKKDYKEQFQKILNRIKGIIPKKVSSDLPPDLPNSDSKFNLEKILTWVFDKKNKEKVDQVFIFSYVVLGCYLFGKTTARVIFPFSSEVLNSSESISINKIERVKLPSISRNNPLNLKNSASEKKIVKKEKKKSLKKDYPICESSSKKSSLSLKLISLTVLKNPKKSLAEIKVKSKKTPEYFRYGEKVSSFGKIGLMSGEKVFLRNFSNGKCEFISLQQRRKSKSLPDFKIHSEDKRDKFLSTNDRIRNEGNSFKIKENLREEMLGNISSVLTQARAIPITNGDGTISFKVTEIVPGSIYSQLNIQENDIITGINGKQVNSINEVTSLLGKIRDITNLSITVERDGEETTQDYSFEK
mgnify:CR=1 FL=1|jgi:type II secretion system protein C